VRDEVRAEDLTGREPYKLLVGSVVPRAIAWVATRSPSGVANIAPYSFFTVASATPPTLCFSIGPSPREGEPVKDTLANIRASGEMTVNIARADLLEAVNTTASVLPGHVDEFEVAGLTPEPATLVSAPRIAEAPISMECRLDRVVEVGSNALVLARVLLWRFEDGLRDDTYVDMAGLRPLGRLAGPRFATELNVVEVSPPHPDDLLARDGDERG
jgi:flavin reductase (DIM6/NTAB) family NADH-FMN oxidoreductase RutF